MNQAPELTIYPRQRLQLSNGCTVSYIDEGSKTAPCILFIHGLANSAMSWARNIEGLSRHFRCVAIDLPGNGYSDKEDLPYSMQFFAACVYDMIRLLDLRNLCICGHSMGGQVAMTLLINAPDAAERLVLCAPAGFEQFSALEQQFYRSAVGLFDFFSTEEQSLKKSIYSSFFQQPQQADPLIEELTQIIRQYPGVLYRRMLDKCVNAMLNEPVYNQIKDITQPALVLFGERDALIPNRLIHPVTTRHLAAAAVSLMPDAKLEMIPQCGHFLQWEKADTVNHLIKDFLSS